MVASDFWSIAVDENWLTRAWPVCPRNVMVSGDLVMGTLSNGYILGTGYGWDEEWKKVLPCERP